MAADQHCSAAVSVTSNLHPLPERLWILIAIGRKLNLDLPDDWITTAYRHEWRLYKITIFGKKMHCCSCGISSMQGWQHFLDLHYTEEVKTQKYLEEIAHKRDQRSRQGDNKWLTIR